MLNVFRGVSIGFEKIDVIFFKASCDVFKVTLDGYSNEVRSLLRGYFCQFFFEKTKRMVAVWTRMEKENNDSTPSARLVEGESF